MTRTASPAPATRCGRGAVAGIAALVGLALAACSGGGDAGVPETALTTGSSASTSSTEAASAGPGPSPSPSPSPSQSQPPSVSPSPSPSSSSRPGGSARRYVFPVLPVAAASFGHVHHDYPATDIFAPCGDTYRAPTSGRITQTTTKDTWSSTRNAGATRGGLSVTLVGDDGVRYYASHFSAILPGVRPGLRVVAGQRLAVVGHTGSARPTACHVHFGISPQCHLTGDWWNRRGVLYPWPYLEAWRRGVQKSPVAAVAALPHAKGCSTKPLVYP